MHGLREPYAVRIDLFDRGARLQPELQRHERRHITAEAVDYPSPHHERLYLIIPQPAFAVVEINNVRPVAYLVARTSVRAVVEPLRMLPEQRGIRRGVVIDHVYHAFHAARVYLIHEDAEILHRAVGGVHLAVIPVRVGAAETAFLPLDPDGVNGHEPDNIRPQCLDAVKIGNHRTEGSLRRMAADIY